MQQIEVSVTVRATPAECFAVVADPANVPRYMSGVKTYEPLTADSRRKGARFHSVAVIAGKSFEVEMEITSWKEGERIVATAVKGPKTQGSWTIEEYDDGTCDVLLLHEYELPGVFRLLPSGPINASIKRELEKSLERLRKLIEASAASPTRRSSRGKKT